MPSGSFGTTQVQEKAPALFVLHWAPPFSVKGLPLNVALMGNLLPKPDPFAVIVAPIAPLEGL